MKKAFTLGEILIVIIIIGFLIVLTLRSFNSKSVQQKLNYSRAQKAVEVMNQAAARIRLLENESCPEKTFIIESFGTNEKGLLKCSSGTCTEASSSDAMDIFSQHAKFEQKDLNFCDYSGNCSVSASAAKIAGGIYIGLQVLDTIGACPNYYIPGSTDEITPTGKVCWAKLYVDTNGKEGPNELGEDVFVFGMDKDGVLY